MIEQPGLLQREARQRHRLTVDEYHRMAEAGVLAPDARVELIEGEIIDMAPMKSRHASAVGLLTTLFAQSVGQRALVWCQLPLRLDKGSEPEPDLMLLAPRDDFYASAHPTAADVLLLVEVSDSTARYDREVKLPLYARHGVAEVWIVDLDAGQVHFHRQPRAGGYAESRSTTAPGSVAPVALPDAVIDLSRLLI